MAPSNDDLKSNKAPTPTEGDSEKPTNREGEGNGKQKKSLKEMAESNPTALGDPVSLKAEKSDTEPTNDDRGASKTEREKKRDSKM